MSTSKSRPADSPNPTRQMLDELDALMERMLALPVNDLEEPLPAPPPPLPALSATLTEAPPEPATEPEPRPRPPEPRQSGKVLVGRLSPSYTAPDEPAPPPAERPAFSYATPEDEEAIPSLPDRPLWEPAAPPSSPPSENKLPPLIVPKTPPPAKQYPRRRSLFGWCLQPLVWINVGYDRSTGWLGVPGRWLRSNGGRMMLGYVGLGMLCLAAAWLLRDWLGWSW